MANPQAMVQVAAAARALETVGMPEARLSIAQAIIYVCESAKSNSVILAVEAAFEDARRAPDEPVPTHLRDTHYAGASERLGYGTTYQYPHDFPGHWVDQQYLPDCVKGRVYYTPSDQGSEKAIADIKARRRAPKGRNTGTP